KEFALAEVFSSPVAEAHLRGEIHLHHLGLIDRLHGHAASLESVARHGISLHGQNQFALPARYPEVLLAQMVKANDLIQRFFAEGIVWEAVNVVFAPYVHGREEKELRQFAQMIVYEFAYRAMTRSAGPAMSLMLHWEIPPALAARMAI